MKEDLRTISHQEFLVELQRTITTEERLLKFLRNGRYVIQRPWAVGKVAASPDKPPGVAKPTEKPTLAAAIEWGKKVSRSVFIRTWNQDKFDRLVEAGEFEERWIKIWKEKEPSTFLETVAEKDRRIEELKEQRGIQDEIQATQERELQALHRQLDASGKENAGKGRRIKELKKERKAWTDEVVERGQIIKAMGIARDHRLDEDEEVKDLRSRLVGRERELERCGETICNQREQIQGLKDKTLKQSELFFEQQREVERLRKSDGCKTCRVCPYVRDLETAEKELERLRGMLDRLLEQSDPPENPPTEAEVEKVGEELHHEYSKGNGSWDAVAGFVDTNFVARSKHERIVGELRKQIVELSLAIDPESAVDE